MIHASFRIVAPEGKREELLEVMLRLKGPTEAMRGCRGCRIVQDVEDADALTYFVEWESETALYEHLRCESLRWLLPYIEMSAEPPEVRFSRVDDVRGIELLVAAISALRDSLG